MKQFFFFVFFYAYLSGCNQNETKEPQPALSTDVPKADSTSKDTSWKTVKASATLTSDSLTPGKTTAESWRVAGFNDPEGFKTFFKEFRKWVDADNKDSIAAHIKFPLRNCKSAALFKKNYTTYFNDKVKRSVGKQDMEKFFANYNGAMTGDGELWFNEIDHRYYVIAVNNKM